MCIKLISQSQKGWGKKGSVGKILDSLIAVCGITVVECSAVVYTVENSLLLVTSGYAVEEETGQ